MRVLSGIHRKDLLVNGLQDIGASEVDFHHNVFLPLTLSVLGQEG